MLPKRTLFISAVLTAFALAALGGVAMTVKQASPPPAPPPTAAPTDAPVATEAATATPVAMSPQDAASLAANVISEKQIYSVESAPINGTDAYKVVFSSGSVVFVGLDGQILSVTQTQTPVVVAQDVPAPVVVAAAAPVPPPSSHSGHGHEGGGEHEGGGDD